MRLSNLKYSFTRSSMLFKKSIGVILFLLIITFANARDLSKAIDSANTAYSKGYYDKAIKLYTTITDANKESAEIYFNLGNAYFKTNNIGLAILNYERAKKLAPNDEDILTNLKFANQKTEDKIENAPQLFLTEWKNGFIDIMNEKSWSLLCISSLCIALLFITLFITSSNSSSKKFGFYLGITVGLLSIILFFIAQQKYNHSLKSDEAIITSTSVTISGSPNEKGTKLFILHEGTKVIITQESDDWTEVKIANGNVGWLKTSELKSI
jgi:tetratricopeptide (TPR) repeat protein